MITFGVCLIYYGLALLLYQINGWATDGRWVAFPVARAWGAFFEMPVIASPVLHDVVYWLLGWPLSLSLLLTGASILGLAFGMRRIRETRRKFLRRRWIEEQCISLGYRSWALPKVLSEIEQSPADKRESRRSIPGRP